MLSLKFGYKWVAVAAASEPVVGRQRHLRNLCCLSNRIYSNGISSEYQSDFSSPSSSSSSSKDFSSLEGLEDVMVGYLFGKKRATEVAHSYAFVLHWPLFFNAMVSIELVWKRVIRTGDTVVDATCGNGYDTLAMLKMVADEAGSARVYAMDVQKEALESTSALLDESLSEKERKLVKLSSICHSRMEDVIPEGSPVRLVAFNLGYLPGGNKAITTKSETTLQALEAAYRILKPGGLISLVVYVGHPGGL
ncbi:ytqB, partial [Cucurbita argyrosperma subsp. argyrosperma]